MRVLLPEPNNEVYFTWNKGNVFKDKIICYNPEEDFGFVVHKMTLNGIDLRQMHAVLIIK